MRLRIGNTETYRAFLRDFRGGALKLGREGGGAGILMTAVRSRFLHVGVVCLLFAALLAMAVQAYFSSETMAIQRALAAAVGKRAPSVFMTRAGAGAEDRRIGFSAFNVVETNPANAVVKKDAAPKPIDAFSLIGTLPGVGAWIGVENQTSLVLRRQEFNGYVLETVEPGRVLFSRDGENFPLYLLFSSATARRPATTRQTPQTQAQDTNAVDPNAAVENAQFNGSDGAITRELLNELLMNPYAEISKIRLVPSGSGMAIRAMRPDSLMSRLGMQQGDVLVGINGVPIKDVSNLSNAINSMLTGSRLDFQVERDGNTGKLGYVVK